MNLKLGWMPEIIDVAEGNKRTRDVAYAEVSCLSWALGTLGVDKREKEKSEKTIVSVTGAVYDTERSILKDVLTRLYSQRSEYKKKSFELQQKAYDIEKEMKNS